MKKICNGICLVFGFLFFGVGAVGVVLPILPTTPFLLLAAFLFAKGSKRFHKWFMNTGIYKKYLTDIIGAKEMTVKAKAKVLLMITVFLVAGYIFSPIWYAKALILIFLIGHYLYFIFRIKTVKVKKDLMIEQE